MARAELTGTRIRERRTARKLKQADLARMVGISPAYLNLIEHNRRRVSETVLEALAEVLGLDPEALGSGASGALFDGLREAAASNAALRQQVQTAEGQTAVGQTAEGLRGEGARVKARSLIEAEPPELDRIEEFVGRYPGWADLLAARQARVSALERTVESYSERMAQDPYLADTLHEVLSSVTSLRSTAAILEETEDIEPEWRARFIRTIHEESLRLSRTAEALVGYLDTLEEAETGISSPQEEVEAWLSARGYLLPEVEAGPLKEAERAALSQRLTAQVPELATDAARDLARGYLAAALADAQALPEADLRAAQAAQIRSEGQPPDPLTLAQHLGLPLAVVLRRMAALDPALGLVACDGSGTLTFRKPVAGFALPRFGAACPLWPLYEALARPSEPIRRRVDVAGRVAQHFLTYSVGELRQPEGFGGPSLRHAVMLIVPQGDGAAAGHAQPPLELGTSCRICPRAACVARREPSIVQPR